MKKQIMIFAMAMVLIFFGSSVTAFAAFDNNAADSSNSSVKGTKEFTDLEAGEYIIGDESVIIEDTQNSITVEKTEKNEETVENSSLENNSEKAPETIENTSEMNEEKILEENNMEENEKSETQEIEEDTELENDIEIEIRGIEAEENETTEEVDLTKPENLAAKMTGLEKIELTWEKVYAANEYEIYRSAKKNKGYKLIGTSEEEKYIDKNIKTGKTYYYKVVAKYEAQSSEYSDAIEVKCVFPAVSGLKIRKSTYNSVALKWNKVKGASGYIIYRSTKENKGYKEIAKTQSRTYTDKKLKTGKKYYYKIAAYKDKTEGEGKIISVTLKPEKVTNLKAAVKGNNIILTWKKAKGASKYEIYRSTSKNKDFEKIGSTKKLKYTDKKAEKGVTYYYRVYGVKGKVKGKYAKCTKAVTTAMNYENMKAVWISYLDYSRLKDKNEKTFRKNISEMYQEAVDNGLNTVIVHVRAFSDAVYPSKYYGWASFVTSNGSGPAYDPLEIMIEEAHKKKLSFHAWINPYRSTSGGVLNPADSKNIDRIVNGVAEIVSGYSVDGIHFDDYFYASGDSTSQSAKMKNVNKMIKKVYSKIKSINKSVVFGISPAGEISYAKSIGCDVEEWLSESGYVDYVMPQLYWSDEYENSSGKVVTMFTNRMMEWEEINENETPLYVGMALYKVGTLVESAWGSDYGWDNADDNLYRQYKSAKEYGYLGYALYRYDWLEKDISQTELKNLKKLN